MTINLSKFSSCSRLSGALFLISAMIFSSCNTEKLTTPEARNSTALFDYFQYTGNDEVYKKNPLTSDSSFYNPILPGWNSDPSICTDGKGNYYIVTSTFAYFPGVPVYHSTDLVNWKLVSHVLTRESQCKNFDRTKISGGIFAPQISYNASNGMYYMITTNVAAGNFIVKTDNPAGEWSDPIYVPQVNGIDPSLFWEEDGTGYVVSCSDPDGKPEYSGHRAIRLYKYDDKAQKIVSEGKVIVNKGTHPEDKPIWCEGPHLYKAGGYYYLACAEGGTGGWHSEVIFRSKTIDGNYEAYAGNPILTQRTLPRNREFPIDCAGHADFVKTPQGDVWAVFLANRPINMEYENLGRETFMMPVKFTSDGWPYMTVENQTVPYVLTRKGVTRSKDIMSGNFFYKDDFKTDVLDLYWMSLRKNISDKYSLKENPGFLTLKCDTASAQKFQAPSLLTRILQHHAFECSSRVIFKPTDNTSAGLLLLKDETHQYYFSIAVQNGETVIRLEKVSPEGTETIASKEVKSDNNAYVLKIKSTGTTFDFEYSINNKESETLAVNVDAKYLSTHAAGGFTGTTIGLYAKKQ